MSLVLVVSLAVGSIASAQSMLMDVMIRHGVQVPGGSYERAFDEGMRPSTPVNAGSFAAGARVAGRIYAVPFDARSGAVTTPGLTDALFALFNSSNDIEQLAAMDALGLMRQVTAVASLTERYQFYRQANKRALAGGALEALARIGDPSSQALANAVVSDTWSEGRDLTALAVAFARERLLKDGSIAIIRQAIDDRSRRTQALGYLAELGFAAP